VYRFDHLRDRILATLGSPAAQLACAGASGGADAFRRLMKAAQAGAPAACCQVGRAYLLGHGVPASLPAALRWLTRAAEAGDAAAQTLLASLALRGVCDTASPGLFPAAAAVTDPQPHYHAALLWAERAAAQGSAEAQAILGYILTDGPDDLRDRDRGAYYYQYAAAAGCAQGQLGWALVLLQRHDLDAASGLLAQAAAAGLAAACYTLGVLAESGAAGVQDFAAAAEQYRIAAEAGHRTAQLRYGMALLAGRGVAADPFHGESWLRRAALGGEPAAAALIGELYAHPGDLPPNYVEAAMWLRRAAEAGHAGAAKTLGHLLLAGVGLTPDPEEAVRWLHLAIAGGETEARNDLARLALAGQVPETDRQMTCHWFQAQAEAGDPAAAFNLGLCLAEGIGVPRDDTGALAWFERAALSEPAAQYWCGRMHAEGRGCEPDAVAARSWFLRAAAGGNADAEAVAGEMLLNGRGGPADEAAAMALFRRAAAAGHAGARFALEVLARGSA